MAVRKANQLRASKNKINAIFSRIDTTDVGVMTRECELQVLRGMM